MVTTPSLRPHHPLAPATSAYSSRRWVPVPSVRATRQERLGAMPGDEIVTLPRYRSTRAVTIRASASEVWPWLVQMGQGRGGLYSYDWVENLLGLDMHSADAVEPSLQGLAEGDHVRLVPEGTEPALQFTVARMDAPHVLVLGPPEQRTDALAKGLPYPCWTFHLRDLPDDAGCRLVVRFQSDFTPTVRGRLAYQVALAPIHLVMERKMMLGIKQRAEAATPLPRA